MVRIAQKDTIAFEPVGLIPGDDTVVRREIKAGWMVPDHYQLEDEGAAPEVDAKVTGLGAAAPYYKHQLDAETGEVKDEHTEDQPTEEESGVPAPRKARGRRPAAEAKA